MSESFAQLLEESFANQKIKTGAILTGIVVGVNADMVIVNAGLKSEAVIPADQFFNERGELEVKVGDDVEVALDTVEDGFGETRLSREKAKRTRTWTRLEEAFQKGEIVTGTINGESRAGSPSTSISSARSCPARSSTCGRCATRRHLEGKTLEFKVIKLDQKRNNVVVSRRAVVEAEYSAEREKLLEEPAGRHDRQGRRQEHHRLRRVRGPGRHRRPAAHHRHGVEARQASVRSRQRRRRGRQPKCSSSTASTTASRSA